MNLQKGQKMKLSDVSSCLDVRIQTNIRISGGEVDFSCFGVDTDGKLTDERYCIFHNQTRSPEGAIVMTKDGASTVFEVDLDLLPNNIQKIVVTASADSAVMRNIISGSVALLSGNGKAVYTFDGNSFREERALILCELYRRGGIWRYGIVANGFNGGLKALLEYFGGQAFPSPKEQIQRTQQVRPPQTVPAPSPEKIRLSKISLVKSGDSHKIDLSKNKGEIHVNLNWSTGGGAVDLDLACMFRLKDGRKGVIQALGNSFGAADSFPWIMLDQDDRSGTSANGENLYFKRPDGVEFAIVFAYIYEGAASWNKTDAIVTLRQKGAPDIEIRIANPSSRERFCVLASLTGGDSGLEVRREERFFRSHREVDKYYQFGFRWVAGRK